MGFVTSFGAHIVAVNLPFYAEKVGISLTMIGVLIAVYDFAEILAKPVFGGIADKKGMKKAMLAGIILFILASLLYPFIPPKLLIVVRFLQGLGAAALSAVSLAMVGNFYKENKGKAFGIYNAIKGAGYVVSPIIGGAIVLKSNFSGIFYASAGIGVLALLLSLTLPNDKVKGCETFDDDDDDFSLKTLFGVFGNKTLMPWFLIIVINMFFVGILFGFLPVRIHDLGYNPVQTGLLVSITTVSYLLIQPLAGWLADKINTVLTLRIGMLLSCLATAAIPFVTGALLVVVCIIAGIGIGTVWTNSDALVSRLASEKQMGATMGVAGSFKELGDMVGPLLMGAISQALGLQWGFVICSVLGFAALMITIIVAQKPAGKNDQ
ncbi:MFS transporter [Flavisolibacter nicotianae]|uniref:MFS transporter n=1 Tax=Flavisolibacter nicotianae TaxID=2364882 RepID=UPI0013C494E4|nr:MFS transporter [Flavisolibacter nicotianae]